jgi:hypothetical protein
MLYAGRNALVVEKTRNVFQHLILDVWCRLPQEVQRGLASAFEHIECRDDPRTFNSAPSAYSIEFAFAVDTWRDGWRAAATYTVAHSFGHAYLWSLTRDADAGLDEECRARCWVTSMFSVHVRPAPATPSLRLHEDEDCAELIHLTEQRADGMVLGWGFGAEAFAAARRSTGIRMVPFARRWLLVPRLVEMAGGTADPRAAVPLEIRAAGEEWEG